MSDAEHNELVAELARDLVRQVAPEELPLFRAKSREYFANPKGRDKTQTPRDEMLGFGGAEAVVFVTPAALAIGHWILPFVVDELKKILVKESATVIFNTARALLKGGSSAGVSPLTAGQLTLVRENVIVIARESRVPDDRARLLADAVVGRLVLSKS